MTNNNKLPEKVRRSWLMASASQVEKAVAAPQSNVDVVLLDLVEFVAEKDKPAAPCCLERGQGSAVPESIIVVRFLS